MNATADDVNVGDGSGLTMVVSGFRAKHIPIWSRCMLNLVKRLNNYHQPGKLFLKGKESSLSSCLVVLVLAGRLSRPVKPYLIRWILAIIGRRFWRKFELAPNGTENGWQIYATRVYCKRS